MIQPGSLVVSLRDVEDDDVHFVGKRPAFAREGFAITHRAYFNFLRDNNLETKITHLLGAINFDRIESINRISQYIENLMVSSKIPQTVVHGVFGHFEKLKSKSVSVYMSVLSGDYGQKQASFEPLTIVEGEAVLLDKVRFLWTRLFRPKLIVYRNKKNLNHLKTGIAVIVQKT